MNCTYQMYIIYSATHAKLSIYLKTKTPSPMGSKPNPHNQRLRVKIIVFHLSNNRIYIRVYANLCIQNCLTNHHHFGLWRLANLQIIYFLSNKNPLTIILERKLFRHIRDLHRLTQFLCNFLYYISLIELTLKLSLCPYGIKLLQFHLYGHGNW